MDAGFIKHLFTGMSVSEVVVLAASALGSCISSIWVSLRNAKKVAEQGGAAGARQELERRGGATLAGRVSDLEERNQSLTTEMNRLLRQVQALSEAIHDVLDSLDAAERDYAAPRRHPQEATAQLHMPASTGRLRRRLMRITAQRAAEAAQQQHSTQKFSTDDER